MSPENVPKEEEHKSKECSVCDEVVKDTTDKVKEKEASKDSIKTVKVEFNEMVKMHDKLSKGEINIS